MKSLKTICNLAVFGVISIIAVHATVAHGQESRHSKRQATATAGAWSNMRNNEDSIKFLSNKLLAEAIENATQEHMIIVFTSIPTGFIDGKTDGNGVSCDQRQQETIISPIVYADRTFADSEKLMDWISNFSQGKGKDGRDLYNRCSGSCSPQYKYYIQQSKDGGFTVTAEVICGKARDKNEDLYELTVELREIVGR